MNKDSHTIFRHLDTPSKTKQRSTKNRTMQDMTRTMITEYSLPNHIWTEVVSITCHILNSCLIRPILKKIPYELWKSKRPNISYFHPFGCKCFVHNNDKDNLESLILGVMKVYFLATQTLAELVGFTTSVLCAQKNFFMSYLMILIL